MMKNLPKGLSEMKRKNLDGETFDGAAREMPISHRSREQNRVTNSI